MGNRIDPNIILGIIIILIYSFLSFSAPLSILFIILVMALTFLRLYISNRLSAPSYNHNATRASRTTSLENVRLYLSPYTNMWENLKISNKYCILRLGPGGRVISGEEKTPSGSYRKFRIVSSKVHTIQELWDMFCLNFDYLTSYDGLIELCNTFKADYAENIVGVSSSLRPQNSNNVTVDAESQGNVEKIDINNASEVEITSLPGISIVLSKKIIKRREEIGGFKNLDEFFSFLKIKPHMEAQLRNLICINKMKGSVYIQRNKERSIDL